MLLKVLLLLSVMLDPGTPSGLHVGETKEGKKINKNKRHFNLGVNKVVMVDVHVSFVE